MAFLLSARVATRHFLVCQKRNSSQLKQSVGSAVAFYNDLIGITETTNAKANVITCENKLSEAQLQRRHKQFELRKLQSRLKDIHGELDRTPRGDDRYLHLITEEHGAIKKEQALLEEFELLENTEREAFHELSNKIRISHEKEREREERTKYWALMGSGIVGLLGITGTAISFGMRASKDHKVVVTTKNTEKLTYEIAGDVHNLQKSVAEFLTEMKRTLRLDSPKLADLHLKEPDGSIENCLNDIKSQNIEIGKQLKELKRLVALDQALDMDPNTVVYVGDEMELLLKQTEENIESKMKLQTLVTVVLAYGVIALTLPLLYLWYNKDV